ncbi:hypothetical protein [Embleya scabrispora]|uniref:hypothetical protein n=1 Tax=Embleya scabrispora TaxID=159449 RepID=UPI002AA2AD4E|nr:hypothetical protein [Embleya scabrispora]
MPQYEAYVCEYTANWIAMKLRWGLSVDAAERDTPAVRVAAWPDVELTGSRAR